jgi:NAD-dependent histone deacetylase SIR2
MTGEQQPDITFFGESLPDTFYTQLNDHDRTAVDLVLVIGTSMKVAPVSEIPQHLARQVPHIYISRDPCKHIEFDVTLLGDCDSVVAELCRRTGWELKHSMVKEGAEYEVAKVETENEIETEGMWKIIPKSSDSAAPTTV